MLTGGFQRVSLFCLADILKNHQRLGFKSPAHDFSATPIMKFNHLTPLVALCPGVTHAHSASPNCHPASSPEKSDNLVSLSKQGRAWRGSPGQAVGTEWLCSLLSTRAGSRVAAAWTVCGRLAGRLCLFLEDKPASRAQAPNTARSPQLLPGQQEALPGSRAAG